MKYIIQNFQKILFIANLLAITLKKFKGLYYEIGIFLVMFF
jgi:hypothetical protein